MNKDELKKTVFEALGEASMCWSETPNGVFESSRAEEIGNRVMKAIEEYVSPLPTSLPSDEEIYHRMQKRKFVTPDGEIGYQLGMQDMRSIASARIAEMEREINTLKEDLRTERNYIKLLTEETFKKTNP